MPCTWPRCSPRERGREPLCCAGPFEEAASAALEDAQTRANVLRATTSIRARRGGGRVRGAGLGGLRLAGEAIRDSALARLDELLVVLEAR